MKLKLMLCAIYNGYLTHGEGNIERRQCHNAVMFDESTVSKSMTDGFIEDTQLLKNSHCASLCIQLNIVSPKKKQAIYHTISSRCTMQEHSNVFIT